MANGSKQKQGDILFSTSQYGDSPLQPVEMFESLVCSQLKTLHTASSYSTLIPAHLGMMMNEVRIEKLRPSDAQIERQIASANL